MSEQLDDRVIELEKWRIQVDLERTADAVDKKHLYRRLDDIEGSINSLKDTLTWFTRVVVGATVIVIVTFALKGGFII